MHKGRWLRDEVVDPTGIVWPRWVPVVAAGCATVVALGALLARDSLLPPGPEALLALVAISPWLVDAASDFVVPRPLASAVVIICTAGLLLDPTESDLAPFLLILLALCQGGTGSFAVMSGTVVGASAVMVALSAPDVTGEWWQWIPGIVVAGIGGFAMQSQLRLLQQERTTRVALAERLAAEDRQRIARDVHDVVAHSLSVTMLHLTAARHALESDAAVDEAIDSLREAERLGRQAMGDIRRTVGLLDGAPSAHPLPGLDDLPDLVDEFRTAGIDVRYQLLGELTGLSPAADLDVYRVAEESLSNVVKHAPGGQVDVALDARGDQLELRVLSTRPVRAAVEPDGTGGRGIPGMRQRVELLGGTLQVGATGTEWSVVARIPRDLAAQ